VEGETPARARIFLNNLGGLGTGKEYGCRTGPPGYIGWRNRFLEIDSWAPQKFKNTVSGGSFGMDMDRGARSRTKITTGDYAVGAWNWLHLRDPCKLIRGK
jgi:hypothetical protein